MRASYLVPSLVKKNEGRGDWLADSKTYPQQGVSNLKFITHLRNYWVGIESVLSALLSDTFQKNKPTVGMQLTIEPMKILGSQQNLSTRNYG